MTLTVGVSPFYIFSVLSVCSWKEEKVHFPHSILPHLEMLSSLLLGVLVKRPFPLCALKNEEGTHPRGFTKCASSSMKLVEGKELESCNQEICIPDVTPPLLLWDLCLCTSLSSLLKKKVCLKVLPCLMP